MWLSGWLALGGAALAAEPPPLPPPLPPELPPELPETPRPTEGAVDLLPVLGVPWATVGNPGLSGDVLSARVARILREEGADRVLGAVTPGTPTLIQQARLFSVGIPGAPSPVRGLTMLAGASVDLGTEIPDNANGWQEPGIAGLSLLPSLGFSAAPFQARFTPRIWGAALDVRGDLSGAVPAESVRVEVGEPAAGAPAGAGLRIEDAWIGADTGNWRAGFGKEARWLGPGRFGTLILSDNAAAPWMGGASAEGRLPGKLAVLGRWRGEWEAGLLDRPRRDVQQPGLMLMDLRWMPVPQFEAGLSRITIFGGQDRPPIDLGQLLLPTEPHIYNDPDRELPDQNELARIDMRLTLPLKKWLGAPVDYVEGWWEYGGEDVIKRELGPIPYPALAGIGNLYGGEIMAGPLVATLEYSQLMDDYFRWYMGHRVYHDGFTQDLRVLGHAGGPDSQTWTGGLAWEAFEWRVALQAGTVRRVAVVEAFNDRLFALPTEEHRQHLDLEGGVALGLWWLEAAGGLEQIRGLGYVPGTEERRWRASVSITGPGFW